MKNISFFLTQRQIGDQSKTVTRRLGWRTLKPGTLLQPVVKGQGLKKGETVQRIGGPIRIVSVTRERLDEMEGGWSGDHEAALEGFPSLNSRQFIDMFCEHNTCEPNTVITRIAFEYVETTS